MKRKKRKTAFAGGPCRALTNGTCCRGFSPSSAESFAPRNTVTSAAGLVVRRERRRRKQRVVVIRKELHVQHVYHASFTSTFTFTAALYHTRCSCHAKRRYHAASQQHGARITIDEVVCRTLCESWFLLWGGSGKVVRQLLQRPACSVARIPPVDDVSTPDIPFCEHCSPP